MKSDSPCIAIEKVRVLGERGLALDQELKTSGISVIRGENSSGRTTFLKIIEYGLGANVTVSKFFIPELQNCQKVLIQILINGDAYTLERKIKRDSNKVSIYEGEIDGFHQTPRLFNLEELSDFLLYKLEIPRIAYVDSYSGREKRIDFTDIVNALYIDQERGFTEVHSRIRGELNRINLFKLLTKISIPDLYLVETEEESLKKEIKRLQQEYESVTKFLGKIELPTLIEIQTQIDSLSKRKVEVEEQARHLKESLRSTPGYVFPLREEILQLEEQVSEKRRDLNNTKNSLRSYDELENQLYDDLDKLARIRVSTHLLSSYEVEQCPRCLQPITIEMRRLETEGYCSLCNRPIKSDPENVEDFVIYEKQVNSQINELHELKAYYTSSHEQLTIKLNILEGELQEKKLVLDEAIKDYTSPLLSEIEMFGSQNATIDEQINRLNQLALWRKQVELMQEKLKEQLSQIDALHVRKMGLIEEENAMKISIADFEAIFIKFIKDIYPDYIEAAINRENFLPEMNNADYRVKSSTQKDITILGYFYALLRFSIEHSSNIPRILMIDTIRQDDLSNEIYDKVLLKFKELEDLYKNSFQLILVIRDSCSFLRKNERLQLVQGTKLLRV